MWLISLSLCAVVLSLWIIWRKKKLSLFERLNIPGPPPNLLFGNYWELIHEGQNNCIDKWIEQYGKVFGYYYGLRPVLIVADLDLIRRIQQKEFHKFPNRPKLFEVGRSSSEYNGHSLTNVEGQKWKDLRSIMTPTFTTAKLKMMSFIINEAIDELVQATEKESASGKPFDIYHLYQNLTMDVIARTSLGIHTNAQTNKDDPFVKLARIIFSFRMNYLAMFSFSFAEIMPLFSFIRRVTLSFANKGTMPRQEMNDRTAAAIKARRNNPSHRRPDVLQLMIDAQKTDFTGNDKSLAAGENEDSVPNETSKQIPVKNGKRLTDDEIMHNASLFLLAGYETTSTALAFLTYCLIYHQDIQDKVREEINNNVAENQELSYEVVNKLPYLDCVFNEALRIYPPIIYFVNRQAIEDTTIDNWQIPKNIAIQVPVYHLHHDPTIWEEPEQFNPDRFSPEEKSSRHPMAFQPFGAGPRNCIGMRFAQMEAKMAIVKLIRKYRLLPKSGTKKEDFEICMTTVTMRPENGVFVQLERI